MSAFLYLFTSGQFHHISIWVSSILDNVFSRWAVKTSRLSYNRQLHDKALTFGLIEHQERLLAPSSLILSPAQYEQSGNIQQSDSPVKIHSIWVAQTSNDCTGSFNSSLSAEKERDCDMIIWSMHQTTVLTGSQCCWMYCSSANSCSMEAELVNVRLHPTQSLGSGRSTYGEQLEYLTIIPTLLQRLTNR